jgi:GxxExxY protein
MERMGAPMGKMGDERRTAQDLDRITEAIIGCAFKVGSVLGQGFAERVYENALAHELRRSGLTVQQQVALTVWYDDVVVGEYVADVVVEEDVLVELKACSDIVDGHVAQCLNYLKVTGLRVGLLLNFGAPRVQIRRVVNNY